jgi:5-(carboxyamino)imidazole ribonucleotide synthase
MVKRVGVIGGGQLAWMMAREATSLALELVVQTPSINDPATKKASKAILARIDDAHATAELARRCDVITFENEFVDLLALQQLQQQGIVFRPSIDSLIPLLDKYEQRCFLQNIGLPVPRFFALDGTGEIPSNFQFPLVLKARRHGYDGQGTFVLKSLEELSKIREELKNTALMLEEFIPFERELAAIAARNAAGEVVIYPLVETQQKDQVCRVAIAPATVTEQVKLQIEAITHRLLKELQYIGVLGIELFLTPGGKVLLNEVAPRTHNSGHYTLDACHTSQFAMQLQAVADLPLGSSALKSDGAVMVNLLGFEYSDSDFQEKLKEIASIPLSNVHWYGKAESRPGRKMGHVTVLFDLQEGESSERIGNAIAKQIEAIWYRNK